MYNIHSKDYQKFIKLLRKARAESGLTQKQVADKLNKPQSFVSKSEFGERRVDFVELVKIAKILGKPLDYFAK